NRARHQQHSSDQGSWRMASDGHHGAGGVGHCSAAQEISAVASARVERTTGAVMRKTAITSPELSPPVGPFSQAVEIDGFLFLSGQVAQDPATGKVVEGGIG